MKSGDAPLIAIPTLLYCTVAGSLGVVAELTDEIYEILEKLQTEMRKLETVGSLDPAV
jgi:hypothetical protein